MSGSARPIRSRYHAGGGGTGHAQQRRADAWRRRSAAITRGRKARASTSATRMSPTPTAPSGQPGAVHAIVQAPAGGEPPCPPAWAWPMISAIVVNKLHAGRRQDGAEDAEAGFCACATAASTSQVGRRSRPSSRRSRRAVFLAAKEEAPGVSYTVAGDGGPVGDRLRVGGPRAGDESGQAVFRRRPRRSGPSRTARSASSTRASPACCR